MESSETKFRDASSRREDYSEAKPGRLRPESSDCSLLRREPPGICDPEADEFNSYGIDGFADASLFDWDLEYPILYHSQEPVFRYPRSIYNLFSM